MEKVESLRTQMPPLLIALLIELSRTKQNTRVNVHMMQPVTATCANCRPPVGVTAG